MMHDMEMQSTLTALNTGLAQRSLGLNVLKSETVQTNRLVTLTDTCN